MWHRVPHDAHAPRNAYLGRVSSTQQTPRTGRRLAPQERRRQLIEVAFAIFGERPYDEVVLDDVAEAAGVRRGLVYHYFPTGKTDLFAAVLAEALSRTQNAVDTDPDRPLEEKLPANFAAFLDLAENEDTRIYRIFREARTIGDPSLRAQIRDTRREIARRVALNHLGTRDPAPIVLAALEGWMSFCETVVEGWLADEAITRAQVEALLSSALPEVVASARAAAES